MDVAQIRAVAKKIGLTVIELTVSKVEPDDLIGIPEWKLGPNDAPCLLDQINSEKPALCQCPSQDLFNFGHHKSCPGNHSKMS